MKKRLALFLAAAAVLAAAAALWFGLYYQRKSNDNLPALSSVAQMNEAEINKIVCGYRRGQLDDVWGRPDETADGEDVWSMDGQRFLRVNYNNRDRAIICGIEILLFPPNTETVNITYSAGTAESSRKLNPTEINSVMDWAAGLDLRYEDYAEGEAPNEVYAGGESCSFEINGGEASFSYVWIDDCYIVLENKWYAVENPSWPPVEADGMSGAQ